MASARSSSMGLCSLLTRMTTPLSWPQGPGKTWVEAAKSREICFGRSLKLTWRRNGWEREFSQRDGISKARTRWGYQRQPGKVILGHTQPSKRDSLCLGPDDASNWPPGTFFFSYFNRYIWFYRLSSQCYLNICCLDVGYFNCSFSSPTLIFLLSLSNFQASSSTFSIIFPYLPHPMY